MVYIFFVYFTLHCIYFLYTLCAINNCFYTVYSVIYLHFSADVPCWGWLKKFSVRTDKLCLEKFVHVICFLVDGFCYYIPCLPYLKKLRFHLDLGRTIGIWKNIKIDLEIWFSRVLLTRIFLWCTLALCLLVVKVYWWVCSITIQTILALFGSWRCVKPGSFVEYILLSSLQFVVKLFNAKYCFPLRGDIMMLLS